MDLEAKLLLFDAFKTFKNELVTAFRTELPNPKDSEASDEIRKKGNALFLKKHHSHELHKEILSHYNESTALAPSGSQELASAYANRSAFLLHVDKYEECIQDIQKALEITESNELKIKLLCRKVECLKKLGSTCENALDEAKSLLNFIDGDDDKKQKLNEIVTAAAALLVAKKDDTNQEATETINLPVTDNVLEKVSIRHNKKYGRHLVAEQDYIPGDIIFVEKLFSISVKPPHRYTNCHHCLRDCWTGVPCDNCNWAIFCSEDCKQEAWKEYHDIECSVGVLLDFVLDVPWISWSMSIKIFIKAMKDAGTVENLRAQLEAVDQCTDICSKGFYKDGKFSNCTMESFYSLTKKNFTSFEEKMSPQIALITLIGLLKHPLLKGIFSITKVKDLIQNKDLVFLGSLLIKFTAIRLNNSISFIHYLSIFNNRRDVSRSIRGSGLAVLASLINSSCCPNANVCFTEDGKIIVYALQPVKKDSQIFISYTNEYYCKSLEDRKKEIKNYNFECDCEACTESWPALLLRKVFDKESHLDVKDGVDINFLKQCDDIIDAIMEENYSKATLEKLVERITMAFNCLKQPSPITCIMFDGLNSCITNVYNGLKPQMFGKCKKLE